MYEAKQNDQHRHHILESNQAFSSKQADLELWSRV